MIRRLFALWLILTASAWAQEQPIVISTLPSGASLIEETDKGRSIPPAADGRFEMAANVGRTHTYLFSRPPFDNIRLTVRWNEMRHGWEIRSCTPQEVLRGSMPFLPPHLELAFTRTVRINAAVSPVRVLEVLAPPVLRLPGMLQSHVSVVRYGGKDCRYLTQTERGFVIPRAWHPPDLVVEPQHRAFRAALLQNIPEGALDGPIDLFPAEPIRFSPVYGWFSYWQFNAGLAAALLILAGFAVRWRRRRQATRQTELLEREAARVIASQASHVKPSDGRVPPLIGDTLQCSHGQTFRVLRLLGQGAMGAVFEVLPTSPGSSPSDRWAVKVLTDGQSWQNEEFRQRYMREVDVCSQLTHPGIVKVLDYGIHERIRTDDGSPETLPFMVMEMVLGRELRESMERAPGRMPLPDALRHFLEILQALKAAHEAGVVHRDLKPENIMITQSGHIKIMDFGLARDIHRQALTQTNAMMGTPLYMSPEHLNARHVLPASDLYSLGTIMYELLAGHPPWETGDLWQLFTRMAEDPPPLRTVRPDLPAEVTSIVDRLMIRDLSERYATADAVIADLTAYLKKSGLYDTVKPKPAWR